MSSLSITHNEYAFSLPIQAVDHLFFVAGEPSGDLLGSRLIEALKGIKLPAFGVGGPLMQQAGLYSLGLYDNLQVMGIQDVLWKLPTILQTLAKVKREILEMQPKAVILIDYPGFNLRLAKLLRLSGYQGKIIQYVSPTIWAWKKHRLKSMEKYLDLVLCLFPFEPKYYETTKLDARFVGHPLQETLPLPTSIPREKYLLLFPGSRRGEIEATFPKQAKAAKAWVEAHPDYQIAISVTHPQFMPFLKQHLGHATFFSKEENHDWMQKGSLAIATSGTITLELAWFHLPTVVLYGLSPVSKCLATLFQLHKLPFYCIVNIVKGQEVFPEKIKRGYDPKSVVQSLEATQHLAPQLCQETWELLKTKTTPSQLAAQMIQEIL